jgi:starch synthase
MRIAIAAPGRFHVCDLARELAALGHDVSFHSLVPAWRTRRFGLDDRNNVWLGPRLFAHYGAHRLLARLGREQLADRLLIDRLDDVLFDRVASADLLIAMSGFFSRTLARLVSETKVRVVVERGSRHVLSQARILSDAGAAPIDPWTIARELDDYRSAHRISVLSRHARQSFLDEGVPDAKLATNPCGVDLGAFPPTPAPSGPPTLLHVGAWSRRKGCDLLVEAWRRLPGVRLLHVGGVMDLPLPTDPGFTHVDPVPQSELPAYYAQAHLFVLASREDGLGMVIAQALACGLPVVASDMTGGPDFRALAGLDDEVAVFPSGDVDALTASLERQLRLATQTPAGRLRDLLGLRRDALSWRSYGERYDRFLRAAFIDPT